MTCSEGQIDVYVYLSIYPFNSIFVLVVLSKLFATLFELMHLCFNNISPSLGICRYGKSNHVKREIPSHLHPTWGIRGENCDSVCARASQRCNPEFSSIIDRLFCLPSYSNTVFPLFLTGLRFSTLQLRCA